MVCAGVTTAREGVLRLLEVYRYCLSIVARSSASAVSTAWNAMNLACSEPEEQRDNAQDSGMSVLQPQAAT